MAESSNSLSRVELKIEVADFLGYTRDSSNWSTDQTTRVESCVDNGIRQFYSPPKLPEQIQRGEPAHEWSFLKPWTTLSISSGDWNSTAPDDFANFAASRLYYTASSTVYVDVTSASEVMRLREHGTSSSRPEKIALRPAASDGSDGQRYQFVWWPTADDDYTLNYPYYVLQDATTNANPYPLGGAAHALTVQAACLAWADDHYKAGQYGRRADFLDRLRWSIDHDRRFGAQRFGLMHDDSDDLPIRRAGYVYSVWVEGTEMT